MGEGVLIDVDVLVVDDDPVLRLLLTTVLRDLGTVRTAADAYEAVDLVNERLPDVVVLDVMMPGTTGLQLLARWRADERTANLPVMLLTALDDAQERRAGLEAGADAYLTKPFEAQMLPLLVRQLAMDRYSLADTLGRT